MVVKCLASGIHRISVNYRRNQVVRTLNSRDMISRTRSEEYWMPKRNELQRKRRLANPQSQLSLQFSRLDKHCSASPWFLLPILSLPILPPPTLPPKMLIKNLQRQHNNLSRLSNLRRQIKTIPLELRSQLKFWRSWQENGHGLIVRWSASWWKITTNAISVPSINCVAKKKGWFVLITTLMYLQTYLLKALPLSNRLQLYHPNQRTRVSDHEAL